MANGRIALQRRQLQPPLHKAGDRRNATLASSISTVNHMAWQWTAARMDWRLKTSNQKGASMSLEDVYYLSQILAAIAIVASLVFVGLQIHQSDKTQRAIMHQARIQRSMHLVLSSSDVHFVGAMERVLTADASTSATDLGQAANLQRAMVLNLEDVVWQHKAGLLDDESLENVLYASRARFASPGMRAFWQMTRDGYGRHQVEMMEKLVIAAVPMREPQADTVATWRALTAQLSAVRVG